MNGNRVMLQASLNGGFRPPKEAREIEAALERMELEKRKGWPMKYHNVPRRCRQGTMHQSTLEAHRCDELHILEKGGLISDLQAHPQPAIRLDIGNEHVCTIIPDFYYVDDKGNEIWEDTKGHRTEVWMLKRKLLWALKRIEIREVRA